MMRKAPASSMQKTYDECYLICSTAIYFEGQNNEAEALRSWRNALDQIYYHNAYKMPSSFVPKSETEKALHDSLRSMELQCKERVDLLEALKKSRQEALDEAKKAAAEGATKSRETINSIPPTPLNGTSRSANSSTTWLGQDTVPQTNYADIPRPSPLPERRPPPVPRPSYLSRRSSDKPVSKQKIPASASSSPKTLAPPSVEKPRVRTPSPEKKSGMLKTLRSGNKERSSSGRSTTTIRTRPLPAAAKAATQVWGGQQARPQLTTTQSSTTTPTWDPFTRSFVDKDQSNGASSYSDARRASDMPVLRPPSPTDYQPASVARRSFEDPSRARVYPPPYPDYPSLSQLNNSAYDHSDDSFETARHAPTPPPVPAHASIPATPSVPVYEPTRPSVPQFGQSSISYMKEYPNHPPQARKPPIVPAKPSQASRSSDSESSAHTSQPRTTQAPTTPAIPRKAINTRATGVATALAQRQKLDNAQAMLKERVKADPVPSTVTPGAASAARASNKRRSDLKPVPARVMTPSTTDESPDSDAPPEETDEKSEWDRRVEHLMKNLPKGVDELAAKQIFNEIVIQGDEVHWDDVAGLEIAKSALKETVVYPFLRPDLFMGLREPARGMLLFGPPGTGKTMLARAVATESKSVFFAISASSLTSKYLGESEKLVRALFALAKALAPSIIFVDEIDSLLSARGGNSEHEATRRIKTEFLIQWSDLQKAAAGRESADGDATRVLVLAATNLPWAIDEAARRRFVRRQYIPLPEDWVREKQLRTLLAAQKHGLRDRELKMLVRLTDGFSGSDITALAKDAAMGPLRALGEKLLHMSPDEIRPIQLQDFEASLVNIRPSVSKAGLQEFEDWAREFGERGG